MRGDAERVQSVLSFARVEVFGRAAEIGEESRQVNEAASLFPIPEEIQLEIAVRKRIAQRNLKIRRLISLDSQHSMFKTDNLRRRFSFFDAEGAEDIRKSNCVVRGNVEACYL